MKPFTVVCTSVHLMPGDSELCVCALVCVCWRVRLSVHVFVSQRRSLPSYLHLLSQRCLLQHISTSSKNHTKVCCRFLKNTNLMSVWFKKAAHLDTAAPNLILFDFIRLNADRFRWALQISLYIFVQ